MPLSTRWFVRLWPFFGLLGIGDLTAAPANPAAVSTPTRWERSAQTNRLFTDKVTWLTHEPLNFLLRRGDHFDDEAKQYAKMGSPENIRLMAQGGVRYAMVYFYKGMGLATERPAMVESKRIAEELHKNGIKVGLYIGGTMFTETLYHERPEARQWEQRNQDDHWVPYGSQTFRHYACPNEPAYRDYLKQILKIGVEDLHADQMVFDNVMLQAEPDSCRCPRCLTAFHNYLRTHYPTQTAMLRRFGIPNADWIVPNEWDNAAQAESLSVLNDPVLQEWTRFRCESLAHYADDLADYVKKLNPNVAVLMNIKGVYSWNRYWVNAVYHPLYAGHVDIIAFDTGGYDARLDAKTGALVSQIRSYKMARDIGASCDAPLNDELLCAQNMAFAYESPVSGYAGSPWMAARSGTTPMLEFYRHYFKRFYTGNRTVADVAVLRNWPSMAYSLNATYTPATLMEQVLIQHQVPFDLVFDEEFTNLNRYGSVVLAGQECVSDAQVEQILEYVRQGGTLLLSDNTGDYNQWREKRRKNPFLPARAEGRGRIVYVGKIQPAEADREKEGAGAGNAEPGADSKSSPKLAPAQWLLPKNHQEIYTALTNNLTQELSLVTTAPLTTVTELMHHPETRETLIHFVNFDRKHPLAPFEVSVKKQYPGAVKSVSVYSPDADEPVTIPFTAEGATIHFTLPGMQIYSMVVVKMD